MTTTQPIVIPTTSGADITTTSEPYCCKSKGLWSLDKKAWCCKHYGAGCPTTAPPAPTPPTPPPPTTSLPYDCNAGYHGCYHCLIKQWSVSKLAWCCQHMGRGCPTTPPR